MTCSATLGVRSPPTRPGEARAAVNLAQAIYHEKAFGRLPILADALEEAGCHHAEMLAHCRSDGEHCRGCWVVDILTGRE